MTLELALTSAGFAAIYGVAKYAKNHMQDGTGFSITKFLPTVIISAAAGFILGGQGITADNVSVAATSAMLASLGADRFVEAIAKLLGKYVTK